MAGCSVFSTGRVIEYVFQPSTGDIFHTNFVSFSSKLEEKYWMSNSKFILNRGTSWAQPFSGRYAYAQQLWLFLGWPQVFLISLLRHQRTSWIRGLKYSLDAKDGSRVGRPFWLLVLHFLQLLIHTIGPCAIIWKISSVSCSYCARIKWDFRGGPHTTPVLYSVFYKWPL